MADITYRELLATEIDRSCRNALLEDLGYPTSLAGNDITAALIGADVSATARLITREAGVFCGQAWLEKVFELLGGEVSIDWQVSDGEQVAPKQTLCLLDGNARQLLTGERTAMNFIQTLSATATTTARLAQLISHTECKLLDTRKTLPGLRYGQKYAVSCGGGDNHRLGLWDAYLIKENHIIACGGIAQALTRARAQKPNALLEIEVESISELQQALDTGCDVVMLDNFSLRAMEEAVALKNKLNPQVKLEASGNVSEQTIGQIAETGVDFISVGAITKHVQALDLSMRVQLVNS